MLAAMSQGHTLTYLLEALHVDDTFLVSISSAHIIRWLIVLGLRWQLKRSRNNEMERTPTTAVVFQPLKVPHPPSPTVHNARWLLSLQGYSSSLSKPQPPDARGG